MSRIGVVTDSVACLPPEVVRAYDIRVVPIRIVLGQQVFRDNIDVRPEQIYAWQEAGILPTTSQPSLGDFLSTYRDLAQRTAGIVSIHVSAALTGTYNAALQAARMVPEVPIRVIDSRAATMAQGFLVLEAARAAARGASLAEVVARVEALRPRVRFFAVLDTVVYLVRSGRAPALATLAVDVLKIKPILTLRDGRIEVMARVRTYQRALDTMLAFITRDVGRRALHVAVFHTAAESRAVALLAAIRERFNCQETYLTPLSAAMGLYTGPGLVGVAYYTDEGSSGRPQVEDEHHGQHPQDHREKKGQIP